ncbi:OLC1v1010359C1 [Oldenlandia corymbosa var. corymbosa]|uniref:OLC1v1010359C1 n=1 Tax=Oldenlandia corymbosa var. corymbosa TaxID=529605 RepID=A0AAV1DR49_OLDCO|nr:OLC1v1010359C1 [Oldenlandia corymbosa var. corymbosa]
MSENSKYCSSSWSKEENKAFENAFAAHSSDMNMLVKVAAAVPRKTTEEVKSHFDALILDIAAIELGDVPVPNYTESSHKGKGLAQFHKNKKGAQPWTDDEHRNYSSFYRTHFTPLAYFSCNARSKHYYNISQKLFLQGLEEYGKGDWKSISRQYVQSRTPTQVASHAQKFLKRSKSTRKLRPRAHNVTDSNNGEPVVTGQSSGIGPNITATQAHGPVVVGEDKNEAEKFEEYMKKDHDLPDFEIYDQELLPEVEFDTDEFASVDSAPYLLPGYQSVEDPVELTAEEIFATPVVDNFIDSLFVKPPQVDAPPSAPPAGSFTAAQVPGNPVP